MFNVNYNTVECFKNNNNTFLIKMLEKETTLNKLSHNTGPNMPQSKLPSSRGFIIDSGRLRGHRKLNNFVQNKIAGNTLTGISQESHKFCYTSAFPSFYQDFVPNFQSLL